MSATARRMRPVLFVFLAGSALTAIGVEPWLEARVAGGEWPAPVLFVPVIVYSVFWMLYALDRWLLVEKRRYPPGRAFFQVVFGLVFGLLLLPSTLHEWEAVRTRQAAAGLDDDGSLAHHEDPRVRATWVEAIGFRGPTPGRVRAVFAAWTTDSEPRVRAAAFRVLTEWSGRTDSESIREWVDGFLRSGRGGGDDR